MQKYKKEEQKLTIHEKWTEDSKQPNVIDFDDSECDGTFIEIERPNKDK